MDPSQNPFPDDPDRYAIWETLMKRDFEAFLACDWNAVAGDFLSDEFLGLDCGRNANPDRWSLTFPTLDAYHAEWLRQARAFTQVELVGSDKLAFFYRSVRLQHIEITGSRAVAHKRFQGRSATVTGSAAELEWQTLYLLRRIDQQWKITGFVGYLPLVMI